MPTPIVNLQDHERAAQAVLSASAWAYFSGGAADEITLRRNLSMAGWWQCAQLGAVGFRADASRPSCSWQGFTE